MQHLWDQSTRNTLWSTLDLTEELKLIDSKAVKPRIPDDHLIFRIFRAFPNPKEIKVVLLGQDPYPEILNIGEGRVSRACGFSFSSPLGTLPVSLGTIYREILRTYPNPGKKPADFSGDLSHLVAQGVFLINTYLTIQCDDKKGYPATHTSWVTFTTQILAFIRRNCPNAVFLALGSKADDIIKASGVKDALHCDHPASRGNGKVPFIGSGIFKNANDLLAKRGMKVINWRPMDKAVDTGYFNPDITRPILQEVEQVKVQEQEQDQEQSEQEEEDLLEEEEIEDQE